MSPTIMFISFLYALTLIRAATITTTATADAQIDSLITSSCEGALYHDTCVDTLNNYTYYILKNPTKRQVAKLMLAISIKATKNTQMIVNQNLVSLSSTTKKGNNNLKECNEHIDSSLGNLYTTLSELKKSGKPGSLDYDMRMSNVMTWLSAALTDAGDCKDLLSDTTTGAIRTIIRAKLARASEMISSALAVCNKL